ncbi:MAG: tyrosine--tRNA ligase [Opitutales bacterium]
MDAYETLVSNADTVIGGEDLKERLEAGKCLRVKLGVDPTRPDLTFGHMVVFNKLRQFQDQGHQAILLIGDFTTLIGDPSGRSDLRPTLTKEEIAANASTYLEQAYKILDPEKTEVRHNSEWFAKQRFEDCLLLARKMTVSRMLERDDFSKRYKDNKPISIIEFLYPLVQGQDSVELKADIELGGSDQLFNLLVGRHLQKEAGQAEQICLTMPLLVGLDGTKKMSKSQDNYIAFNDSPKEIFGKVMSISDDVMWDYYTLLLLKTPDEIEALKSEHPMKCKKALASELVSQFYGEGSGEAELAAFEKVFSQNKIPEDMPTFTWDSLGLGDSANYVDVMAAAGNIFGSKSEIRRLFKQGAIKANQVKLDDPNAILSKPDEEIILQAGKRKFIKVTA